MEERRAGMDEMKQQIKDIHHILTGNGDPKKGLVFKVARHEDHVSFWNKFAGWILAAAVGVPFAVLTAIIVKAVQHT